MTMHIIIIPAGFANPPAPGARDRSGVFPKGDAT